MDDLRSTLADFDPDAPLPGMPDPWDFMPTPADRPGPPWAMAEMIAAEPGSRSRVAERVVADGSAAALAAAIRGAAAAGEPVVVTGCGTSEHAAMGAAAILRDAWRSERAAGRGPVAAQAFELSLDPPAGGLVIGISHEGGTTATMAAMAAARAHGASTALITGSAASPAAAGADVIARDGRDGPRLVPHGRLRVADRRRGGGRLGALGSARWTRPRSGRASLQGIEAAHAAAPDGSRPDEAIARDRCRCDAPARRRHGRRPGHGARARAQGRGGGVGARGGPRPRDVPPRPPAGDRARDGARSSSCTERAGLDARAKRARQALAAAASLGMRPAAILGADAAALIPDALTPGGRIVVPEAPGSRAGAARRSSAPRARCSWSRSRSPPPAARTRT